MNAHGLDRFTVTEDHVKLLRAAYVGWDSCEFGAPAIDCKRPYGNSDVLGDIAEILGGIRHPEFEEDEDWGDEEAESMRKTHAETLTALQIFLCTGTMEPGTYALTKPYNRRSWARVSP